MSVYSSPIEVVQAALVEAGIEPITSLSSPGRRATVANARYEPTVRGLLTRHAWRFATASTPLTFQGELASGLWRYAYAEPTPSPAKLNNRGVYYAGDTTTISDYERARPVDHGIYNGAIVTNHPNTAGSLVLVYTFRAAEGDWPADFCETVVLEMAAIFLSSLKKDAQAATIKRREAMAKMLNAIARDQEQATRERDHDRQIVDAYIGGGQYRG